MLKKRRETTLVAASQTSHSNRPTSPLDLAEVTLHGKCQRPQHLELLNEKLLAVANGEILRLLITMPPRHGKSLLTSEHFPAWYLATHPDNKIILASYEADFAASWGRAARNIVTEFGSALFGIRVREDSHAGKRWEIQGHRGGMVTAGVGGPITGKGAHLLIIDDPIKNSEEANSFVYRQRTWDWYQSTAYTRLEPNGAVVLIQTRWHDDDLAGRVLRDAKAGGEQWEVLNLPAIAEHNDLLGRDSGQALWPGRYDAERLAAIRRSVGEYFWAALYQQRPALDEGGIVKREWLRYYTTRGEFYCLWNSTNDHFETVLPSECQRFTTVDCAGSSDDVKQEKKGKPPSYSVISTFDFHFKSGRLIWRDIDRGLWDFPTLLHRINAAYQKHNPSWIGIENEKTGNAAIQTLRTLPTRALSHEGKDKLVRFSRAANQFEAGKIYLPRVSEKWFESDWRPACEGELLTWDGHPDTPFDQGDTLGYAAMHCASGLGGAWGGVIHN